MDERSSDRIEKVNQVTPNRLIKFSAIIGVIAIALNVFIQTNEILSAFDNNKDRVIIIWNTANCYVLKSCSNSASDKNIPDLVGMWTHKKTGRTLNIVSPTNFTDSYIGDIGTSIYSPLANVITFKWGRGGFCNYRISYPNQADKNKAGFEMATPDNAPSCLNGIMIKQSSVQSGVSLLAFIAVLLAAICAIIILSREMMRKVRRLE